MKMIIIEYQFGLNILKVTVLALIPATFNEITKARRQKEYFDRKHPDEVRLAMH